MIKINNQSNQIWAHEANFNNWELRQHRFVAEMRDVYFKYLGINPNSTVLDGGCGTGVFTRYLAKGLTTGKITGFDISKHLVDYGNQKIESENLSHVAQLELNDGFNLTYEDESFDAVTNYTYLGVLSDPIVGLKEMIRVCKKGGIVSSAIASNLLPKVNWEGDYPFEFNTRLSTLYKKLEDIYRNKIYSSSKHYFQDEYWHDLRFPKMFHECGLKDIHIYPIAYGFSYNDRRFPLDYRKQLIDSGTNEQIRIINEQNKIHDFHQHDFTNDDFKELIDLLNKKRDYLLNHIESDYSFEWQAGLHYIVTGVKD